MIILKELRAEIERREAKLYAELGDEKSMANDLLDQSLALQELKSQLINNLILQIGEIK